MAEKILVWTVKKIIPQTPSTQEPYRNSNLQQSTKSKNKSNPASNLQKSISRPTPPKSPGDSATLNPQNPALFSPSSFLQLTPRSAYAPNGM